MKQKTKIKLVERLLFFLEFITGVKFQALCTAVLLGLGLLMFNLSTKVSSPELKEVMIFVDKSTTSSRDTIKGFFLECLIDVDGVTNDQTRAYYPDVRSLVSANFVYSLHGISYNQIEHLGNINPSVKLPNGYVRRYNHFKMLGMKFPGMEISDETYTSYPDTLSQDFRATQKDVRFYMLGRTVPHGEMRLTAYSGISLLTPSDKYNPYMNAYFNFDMKDDVISIIDERSKIIIGTGKRRNEKGELPYPYNFTNVWPTPDHVGPDGIEYNTIESVENALKNGIYISAENINKKRQSDRRIFTFTLFLGVIATMFIDNLISLIRKWKEALHNYRAN